MMPPVSPPLVLGVMTATKARDPLVPSNSLMMSLSKEDMLTQLDQSGEENNDKTKQSQNNQNNNVLNKQRVLGSKMCVSLLDIKKMMPPVSPPLVLEVLSATRARDPLIPSNLLTMSLSKEDMLTQLDQSWKENNAKTKQSQNNQNNNKDYKMRQICSI